MSDGYSYDPAGGIDTHTDLIAVTKQLETSLDNLQTAVQRFQAANQGDSVDNYTTAQTLWNNGQMEMNSSMGSGVKALGNIHDNYVTGDQQGAARFAS